MEDFSFTGLPEAESSLISEYLTMASGAFAEALRAKGVSYPKIEESFWGKMHPSNFRSLSEVRLSDNELLELLLLRYGEVGVSIGLLRLSLRSNFAILESRLSQLGTNLLSKSKLLFNKPFLLFQSSLCERRTYFSTVLVSLAEQIFDATCILHKLNKTLFTMPQSILANLRDEDTATDQIFAKALGFNEVDTSIRIYASHNNFVRQLNHCFDCISDSLCDSVRQIQLNCTGAISNQTNLILDSLNQEIARLSVLKTPNDHNLEVWDHYRHSLVSSISILVKIVERLSIDLPGVLQVEREFSVGVLPDSLRRRLISVLCEKGVRTKEAAIALGSLLKYCQDHKVKPQELLASEASKISPFINAQALRAMVDEIDLCFPASIDTGGKDEKERTLQQIDRLTSSFDKFISKLMAVGLFALMLFPPGCGLKTNPKSEIEDFRPPLIFRNHSLLEEKPADSNETEALLDFNPTEPENKGVQ